MGTGRALLRATVTFEVEAAEIWVVAEAPVKTRAAMKVRAANFMITPNVVV